MKIAIVGTGNVARDCYLPALSQADDVQLAYHSRTQSRAEECASSFGGQVFASLADLMGWAPDSVFVLTNETTRADALSQLLALGPRRLFMEKPLTARKGQDSVTEEDFFEARHLMHQAESTGCETAMIFNYRFFDQSVAATDILSRRDFGQPVQAQALVNYACWSHCIDLIHWFAGPVETITALTGKTAHHHGSSEAPDVTAALSFENGATGAITGTWAMDFGFPLFELTVSFERGRLHFRGLDGDLEVLDYNGSVKRHEVLALTRNTSRWEQYRASFAKSIEAYLQSLRDHVQPPVPGVAGLMELQFEAALRRSASLRRPVVLSAEFSVDKREES